jgi:opacity protein-like surface antigen
LPFDKAYAEQATPGLAFLWPPQGHVPGISSIKIAVQYQPQHKLAVLLNGAPVNALNFQGSSTNKAKTVAISRWTGVDIQGKNNTLTAIVSDKSGREIQRIERHVHFTERSVRAELVAAASTLIADGKQRPVLAIRFEDEEGFTPRPRSHGYFTLEHAHWKPIQPKAGGITLDSDFSNGRYEYTVSNDGLVRIELEPTNRSGQVVVNVQLSSGESVPVRAWLKPALRDWLMVGFVKGGVGYKTLSGNMQTLDALGEQEGFYKQGQVSFFAKGRIKGDYLLSIAYDSKKQKGEVGEQLDGVIDPDKWYTLYGDDQSEQYEAPSSSKLYLKLEKEQFSLLFGDYHTDLDVTELGRYRRVLHGLKSVYQGDNLSYSAFASQSSNAHQRDEIRADGTSGLYTLSREPLANSEQVVIEVRDRDHPERILSSRSLARYVDYEIDYTGQNLFFKFPVSGTDDEFNPVLIVVEYESADAQGDKEMIAGGRVAYHSDNGKLETGLTYLREGAAGQQVTLDGRYQASEHLQLKAEIARSEGDAQAGAWLAEADYQQDKLKVRAYAREEQAGFGLGQQSVSGAGQRKLGVESSYAVTEHRSLGIDSSYQTQLDSDTERTQTHIKWQQQFDSSQLDIGYRHTDETTDSGEQQTRQVTLGGSTELPGGKAVLSARLEKGLHSEGDEPLPDRARIGLDYKLSDKTTAFVEQERVIAADETLDNTRVGLKATPWEGGRLHSGYVRERKAGVAADDYRDYATAGLSQQWQVNDKLSVDAAYDRMQTLTSAPETAADDDAQDALAVTDNSDDYQAVSLGASWKEQDWTASGRVEYRDGDREDKRSVLLGMAREVGEQRTVSVQGRITETGYANGDLTRNSRLGLHLAARPDDKGNWFNRLELSDEVETRDGETTQTRKVINNIHYNRRLNERTELSLHHGAKLNLTAGELGRYRSLLDTMQAAVRFDINEDWDVGVQGGYLHSRDTKTRSFFSGIAAGFSPDDNMRIEAGYNFSGFYDDDFDSGHYTHEGPYIDLNYRLDQELVKSLQERQ